MVRVAAVACALLPAALGSGLRASDLLKAARKEVSQGLSFSEQGCYKDTSTRIMQKVSTSNSLTKRTCKATCEDYPYYGLQYGRECWCGDYRTSIDTYGSSNDCDIQCTGNSNVNCGGRYAMRTFTQARTDSNAVGCYADKGDDRVFTDKMSSESMTPSRCESHCADRDMAYYATQYGNECWCGSSSTDFDKHGSGSCDIPCAGDPTKYCGGSYASTVYSVDGSTAAPCYSDTREARVGYNQLKTTKATAAYCSDYCDEFDAAWAFTQYGKECWCGYTDTDVDQHGSGTCDIACAGDNSETCGGSFAFNAYQLDGTASSPTTRSPSPVPSPVAPTPNTSPTPVMTIPSSCDIDLPAIRWAESTAMNGRLYMEGAGCATMTDLYNMRSDNTGAKGPVYILDANDDVVVGVAEPTGKWLLTSELHILTGAVFYCRGKDIGGDCDELRIQSTGSTDYHEVRGHGGSLYFENTVVTSWDTPNKTPQETHEEGRSFLNCVSEYETDTDCDGQPKNDYGECRMDIINSEMGYMGWFDSESYGLTWKVRGFCKDKSNEDIFEKTNVYGDILNSDIHHMYYGMYSYGHQGGVWTNNKMHHNHQYGFDPHDDSDYLTITDNEVYGNVNHGIIASKRCNDVVIANNVVYDGGAQAAGIFLHRSSDNAQVYGNTVYNMQDAGLAMLESFGAKIHDNTFTDVKYGIRISLGGANNEVYDNKFDTCSTYGLYHYEGSDAPEQSDGRPSDNMFKDNEILSTKVGVKMKNCDDITITGNTFTGVEELLFDDAQGMVWTKNSVNGGSCTKSTNSPSFAEDQDLPGSC